MGGWLISHNCYSFYQQNQAIRLLLLPCPRSSIVEDLKAVSFKKKPPMVEIIFGCLFFFQRCLMFLFDTLFHLFQLEERIFITSTNFKFQNKKKLRDLLNRKAERLLFTIDGRQMTGRIQKNSPKTHPVSPTETCRVVASPSLFGAHTMRPKAEDRGGLSISDGNDTFGLPGSRRYLGMLTEKSGAKLCSNVVAQNYSIIFKGISVNV